MWKSKGENNTKAILDWQKVREIRKKADEGVKKSDLAKKYGVSLRTVSAVINREYWREDNTPYIPKFERVSVW